WVVQEGITDNWLFDVLMTDDSSGYIVGDYGTVLSFGNNNTGVPNFITHDNIGLVSYPNPFIDIIHFELFSNSREMIIIEIYDITGRLVFIDQRIIDKGQQTIEVSPGHHLDTGTYFYKINGESIFNTGKIIKTK
ncbi:MAG: T9SS type A sorting domain-containing protein, partial [Bacteroidota bacterium]|nr:T9SS type A sorting domain-containing protein [Bacteroidota bacterium]